MATSRAPKPSSGRRHAPEGGAPTMWAAFAGIMLFLNGSFGILYGLAAIINDKVVTVGGRGVTIWDFKTWGWIGLVVGCLMLATGAGLMAGKGFARWLGIGFALLNALTQFGTVSAFPLWGLLVIALDVIIIYQLSVHWYVED